MLSYEETLHIFANSQSLNEILNTHRSIIDTNKKSIQKNSDFIIEKWCQVVTNGNWSLFRRRLAWSNLELTDVRNAITYQDCVENLTIPNWLKTLDELLEFISVSFQETIYNEKEEIIKKRNNNTLPFEDFYLHFINFARHQLKEKIGQKYYIIGQSAHLDLEKSLLRTLSKVSERTLELEFFLFKIGKKTTFSIISRKEKSTYENDDYFNFINDLLKRRIKVFFCEYSVLARLIVTVINMWINNTMLLIQRLDQDWSDIEKKFSQNKLKEVVHIETDLSDRHQNGKSVLCIHFQSGLKLIYKPKNINLESLFFELLQYFNDKTQILKFKIIKTLVRPEYGWVEFVESNAFTTRESAEYYYHRMGMLLAVSYLLDATDLHFDNIISHGEYPVIIDLETLMHPRKNLENAQDLEDNIQSFSYNLLKKSVLRTGLLPIWMSAENGQSFSSGALQEFNAKPVYVITSEFKNVNTDTMLRFSNAHSLHLTNTFLTNQRLNIDHSICSTLILDGFTQMCDIFIKHKNNLLKHNNILAKFSHQLIRYILRPTRIYRVIEEAGLTPSCMKNGIERSIVLDTLSKQLLKSKQKPSTWSLLSLEIEALEKLDIPLFLTDSGSVHLFNGNKVISTNFFEEPSFNFVFKRLKKINQADIKQQIYFIKGALDSFIIDQNLDNNVSQESSYCVIPLRQFNNDIFVKECQKIKESMFKKSIKLNNKISTWFAPKYFEVINKFQFRPIDNYLYNGAIGIAIFLSALDHVLGNNNNLEFQNLMNSILPKIKNNKSIVNENVEIHSLGELFEFSSLSYGLNLVHNFMPSYKSTDYDDLTNIAQVSQVSIEETQSRLDVISGVAGIMLSFLGIYKTTLSQKILGKCKKYGDHIINQLKLMNLTSEVSQNKQTKLLTGFSHGAAGIAYALLRLYKLTGDNRYKEAAEEAIAYERSVFIPELNNWPDFRQPQTKDYPRCMCSWCHGAPGIGLARVATLDILDTPEIRQDIEAAITTTLNYGLSDIDHLCCGNMGRVEFLFTAGRKLNRPELVDAAMNLASQVVARAEQKGHYGYGPILDFHPGFFQGASGIGYQLLRLAYPDQLPSVLLWE